MRGGDIKSGWQLLEECGSDDDAPKGFKRNEISWAAADGANCVEKIKIYVYTGNGIRGNWLNPIWMHDSGYTEFSLGNDLRHRLGLLILYTY